jgi:hypothetical protein
MGRTLRPTSAANGRIRRIDKRCRDLGAVLAVAHDLTAGSTNGD